jgi:hypothetical protein
MTRLEELVDAARAAARVGDTAACVSAWDAYWAELKKTQEENPLTKLEEMKAARSERLHGLVKKYNKWKAALKRL